MSKQVINIGSAPNDGTGDTIRSSFNKTNLNFTEVYGAVLTSGAQNLILATPSGGAGLPSLRALVSSDLPNLITNTQTAPYTLVIGDSANIVETNSATPTNITIPPNSSVAFSIGTQIIIAQYGVGLTSLVAGVGVTIRSFANNLSSAGQYTSMYLEKRATDEWYLWNGPSITTGALSKTDDTNVTLTLGGTPATALLQATSITVGWSGTLAAIRGGTGIGSNSIGDLIYGSGTNTWAAKNVFNSSQTALLHYKAGTTSASTAPQKYTVGLLMNTTEPGAEEFDNAKYSTNVNLNRYGPGGSIQDFYTDIGNSGSAETDLYTYTTKASTLSQSGEKLTFTVTGSIVGSATASRTINVYFAGTNIGTVAAATISTTGNFKVTVEVIRTGSTTARSSVSISVDNLTLATPITKTNLTGLTFTNTNILKITGTSSGTGSASNDIVANLGWINWFPAANNP